MKEYKLSRISKYSVLYLLSGLFMFFFMFSILSLNSYASAVSDYVLNITSSNGTFFETSGLYHSFSASLQHPEYAYPITTVSGSSSFTRPSGVESVNLEVHVVTSQGDFVVDTHQGTGSYEAFSSVKLEGYPIGYYGVCKGYLKEGTSSTTMTMNVSCSASVSNQSTNVTSSLSTIQSNTNQILTLVGGQGGDIQVSSSYSDYDSWSVENSLYSFTTNSGFGGDFVNSNTPFSFSFPNYSGTSLAFTNVIYFAPVKGNKYKLMFDYYNNQADFTSDLDIALFNNNGRLRQFRVSDFIYTSYGNHKFYILEFDFNYDDSIPAFLLFYRVNTSGTVSSPGIALYKRKYTIDDYMKFNMNEYDNITPSVTDTNTNTSQTVSDINTVNSFETTTFENFDTLADSSGLNSFSLSSDTHTVAAMNFLSTCIVTVYNGFPSDLKWLIQCVGIFGIFALLLSVFGRVGKRINNE